MASVDLVIPCYNYGRFLRTAVESAIEQTGVDVRVLVIDDCSADDTAEVGATLAREYEAVRFRRHAANRGHIATYNEGIAELTADYFLLLSADDYLLPGALARATRLMDEHEDVAFVFGRALLADDTGPSEHLVPLSRGIVRNGNTVLPARQFVALASARNIVPTPPAVVRTSVQQAVGGYRADLPHTGDMEMWLRLATRGNVGYVDIEQAVYRLHGTNMSKGYSGLDDLVARQKALAAFFDEGVTRIDASGALKRDCLKRLSGEAFRSARAALNRGDNEAAARLQDYGLELSPTARLSTSWLKLMAKRAARGQLLSAGY